MGEIKEQDKSNRLGFANEIVRFERQAHSQPQVDNGRIASSSGSMVSVRACISFVLRQFWVCHRSPFGVPLAKTDQSGLIYLKTRFAARRRTHQRRKSSEKNVSDRISREPVGLTSPRRLGAGSICCRPIEELVASIFSKTKKQLFGFQISRA